MLAPATAPASFAVSRDTVMTSILVTEPGPRIFQVSGHAAIRLQCPAYGLDNVFSFETDDRGGLAGQVLGQARGRFAGIEFGEYCRDFEAEGRGITEYPLNLTDAQTRRLWQILDRSIADRQEHDFNIRWSNCNSRAIEKIIAALRPDRIELNESVCSRMDNATLLREVVENDYPWASLLLCSGIGSDADIRDSWVYRLAPAIMGRTFADAEIVSADGARRPLLSGEPALISASHTDRGHDAPSPRAVASGILVFAVLLSICDLGGRYRRMVHAADVALLCVQTAGAVALIFVSSIPASIGTWFNWLFIPFNPLPLIVWLALRKRPACRYFFIGYGIACALFTAAPIWTSQADLSISAVSAAIAIRVLTHYLPIVNKLKIYRI